MRCNSGPVCLNIATVLGSLPLLAEWLACLRQLTCQHSVETQDDSWFCFPLFLSNNISCRFMQCSYLQHVMFHGAFRLHLMMMHMALVPIGQTNTVPEEHYTCILMMCTSLCVSGFASRLFKMSWLKMMNHQKGMCEHPRTQVFLTLQVALVGWGVLLPKPKRNIRTWLFANLPSWSVKVGWVVLK